MGTFEQRIEVAARSEGPFEPVDALVDSGATYSWLPSALLARLGVQPIDSEAFIMADGTRIERSVGEISVKLDNRVRTSMVIFGDEDSNALLGAVTLEAFSMAVDLRNRKLVRVPGYLTSAAATAARDAIAALVDQRRDLSESEAAACMEEIMSGAATTAQLGAFLIALRLKGETVDELTGMARVMREKSLHVPVDGPLLDTCGTGGDGSGTFNVSTAAAFVASGAGARIAKHGNRAMTSDCGSADVLEALGAKIQLSPEGVAACIERASFGFMFAPAFHPAMKHAAGPRREIGVRTVFNILGPLTNPAGAQAQVLGAPNAEVAETLARVLSRLGARHAIVVHGEDGLDEISPSAPTLVYEVRNGDVSKSTLEPASLGFAVHPRETVLGGSPEQNAEEMRSVLGGREGPLRDFTLLNAAAAIVAADMVATMEEGVAVASRSIDSGAARERLQAFVRVSNEVE